MEPSVTSYYRCIKLSPPAARPRDLIRSRISQSLEEGFRAPLMVVLAPSGAGKTTALSHWLAQHPKPFAWLRLDRWDNDPARFLEGLILALKRLHPAAGDGVFEKLKAPEKPSMESALKEITDVLDKIITPGVIILDDFHLLQAPPVHNIVRFLLDNLPGQIRLCLASEGEPPIQLSDLRAYARLSEIRATALAFTIEEASALLRESFRLKISVGDINGIVQRARSRPLNMALAARCLAASEDPSTFLREFESSDEEEVAYMTGFLFQRLPALEKELALAASLSHVWESGIGLPAEEGVQGDALSTLSKEYMLLERPLPDEAWLEMHPLIRKALHHSKEMADMKRLDGWHSKLALWYARQGLLHPAFEHALAASDAVLASTIVTQNSLDLIREGHMVTVAGWLRALPEELVHENPVLSLCDAWVKIISGQLDGIDVALGNAMKHRESAMEPETIVAHVEAIRAYLADRPRID